jgi:soluble P-type ATPase
MIEIDIPGYGLVHLEHLVLDFNGTLSVDGKILPGVKEQLNRAAEILRLHVLTADTQRMAHSELKDVNCSVRVVSGSDLDLQKEKYDTRWPISRKSLHQSVY